MPDDPRKPDCQITGIDGNVFSIIAAVRRCLIDDGQPERAAQWAQDATSCSSYDEVLQTLFDYVEAI